ncbi:MAG: hypothetical protein FWC93_08290 [Defluviitaleaceae bacterium]|nr:hypothetical protein [Defluviitaleaceae bacterium]
MNAANVRTRIVLFISGLLTFAMGTFYFFYHVVAHGRWDDTPMRIVIIILFFWAICSFTLCRIIKNQEEIMRLLQEKESDGGV